MLDGNMVTGIGNSNAVSTSKIMKITAIKKNRDEKGSRVEFFFGSNPHSNEHLFFRSSLIFFEINVTNIIMADDNRMVTIAVIIIIIIIIIYLVFTNFLIGKSSMLFLY
jgi:hypothetical protein